MVQAKVYPVGNPDNDGKMDFAGMNGAWLAVFGMSDQPNKPSRGTIQVASLPVPDAPVEMDFAAAKNIES